MLRELKPSGDIPAGSKPGRSASACSSRFRKHPPLDGSVWGVDTLALPQSDEPASPATSACLAFLETLGRDHRLFALKSYRVDLPGIELPVVPCLDHEAYLQSHATPHVAAYFEDAVGDIHEVVYFPSEERIVLDAAATLAETPPEATERMFAQLGVLFPAARIRLQTASMLRGDVRVAAVVRAQVRLRDVLASEDPSSIDWRLEQLRAIADLMEKESRVSSWAVRTLTAPVLAAAGVATWWIVGLFSQSLDASQVELVRYALLGILGWVFVWIGLKAVHLTEMGTRVWKRSTEYRLIVKARERLAKTQSPPSLRTATGER